MKKSVGLVLCLLLDAGLVAALVLYCVQAHSYVERFVPGTYINGIACAGLHAQQVDSRLRAQYEIQRTNGENLSLTFGEESYEIPLQSVGFDYDYRSSIEQLLASQDSWNWVRGYLKPCEETVEPVFTYDDALLGEQVSSLLAELNHNKDGEVYIKKVASGGYVLHDGVEGLADESGITDALRSAILNGESQVDITACTYDLDYDDYKRETLRRWDELQEYLNAGIQYDMGDGPVTIAPLQAASFLIKDSEGIPVMELNDRAVETFVDSLCKVYDTYHCRRFKATRGDMILMDQGTYGTKIDRDEELAYFSNALKLAMKGMPPSVIHEPNYDPVTHTYVRGRDDLGNTYVEVDMTNQHLYFYKDGKLRLDTDIVTGSLKRGGTPVGAYYVRKKARNVTLRGVGYASFVKYWVAIRGSDIGLHDASWRNKFGGEIYKTNGSHGCVNIPVEQMSELYAQLEVGMPVLVFY